MNGNKILARVHIEKPRMPEPYEIKTKGHDGHRYVDSWLGAGFSMQCPMVFEGTGTAWVDFRHN